MHRIKPRILSILLMLTLVFSNNMLVFAETGDVSVVAETPYFTEEESLITYLREAMEETGNPKEGAYISHHCEDARSKLCACK